MTVLDMTPDELLTTTRSVRRRLDLTRPVPMELVRECLEIALQAPSGSNRQTWHWLVITDAEQRAAIGELYRRAVDAYLESPGAAGKLHRDDPDRAEVQTRVGDSVAYLGPLMKDVPVLVLPCLRVAKLEAVNHAGTWGSILPDAWS
jgi:nitroreductase